DRDRVGGSEGEVLVSPPLADVPDGVRAVDDPARGRQELVVEVQPLDVRLRRVRSALRRDVDNRRRGLQRLAALVGQGDVDADLRAASVVHRIHFGLDFEPALRDRRGDVGDPDDDRGEQDDRHREDQDRADDFGDSCFILAQADFHRVASRWAGENYVCIRADDTYRVRGSYHREKAEESRAADVSKRHRIGTTRRAWKSKVGRRRWERRGGIWASGRSPRWPPSTRTDGCNRG